MKKILTLLLMVAAGAASACAQGIDNVLQFVDENGNVIPDGATIIRCDPVKNDFEEMQVNTDLFVKNTSGQEQGVYLKVNVTKLDGGGMQVCVGSCEPFGLGEGNTGKDVVPAGGSMDIQAEWLLGNAPENAECIVKYQIVRAESLGGFPPKFGNEYQGSTVTVKYINAPASAGIDDAAADTPAKVTARYNANGQETVRPVKGLNIVKLSNGKIIKSFNY